MKRFFALLVWFFPAPFRSRFGAEMFDLALTDYRQARARGPLAALSSGFANTFDLATAALAEHVQATWERPRRLSPKGQTMLSQWTTDLRHAARALRRTPTFTATAVIMLALAIGANTGIFSVVNTVLLEPLPFAHADRLVAIRATAPGSDLPPEFGVAEEFYLQYREQSRLIEDLALFNSFTSTLRVEDRVERVRMSVPTNSLYTTLGARPVLGRLPIAEDDNNVVVISHQLWQTWFGGDSAVLGKSYEISGRERQIVGVMGPKFRFPTDDTTLWISNEVELEGLEPGDFGEQMVARVRPGVSADQLADELTVLASRLPERFGGSPAYARVMSQHRALVRPLLTQLLGPVARPLWVLLGAVGLVLLIACANVANLFMVRAEARSRDLAVRRAIGASRGQVLRLQVSEASIVGVLSALLALLLAALAGPALLEAAPQGIWRFGDVGLDATTVLFTLGLALLVGLACGLAPALGSSGSELARLRESGRGSTGRRSWLRDGLVVGQTALALVLLIGSGLLFKSFRSLSEVDPGYDTRDIFTFQFAPDQEQLTDGPSWGLFHFEFLSRLAALPGVTSVGLVENVPLDEGTRLVPFVTEESAGDPAAARRLNFTWAGGDYFRTMGIDVLAGRTFSRDEQLSGLGAMVVSRAAAELLWPGQDPLGRRFRRQQDAEWHTVVAVVEDVMQDSFREQPIGHVYLPLVGPTPESWRVGTPAYVVKTPRAEIIAPEIRALVREVAPEAPMYRTFTMAGLAADSMADLSFTMLTLGLLSSLALLLGAVGLYGVLSYVVAARTREIGVRMALGATAAQVRTMVVAQGARMVGLSVALGVVVAFASTRAVTSLLFGVAPLDAPTFLTMSASLMVVGLFASYLPARRASSVDPIETLRGD